MDNFNSDQALEYCKFIFESSLDAILLTRPDGTIFYVNSAAEELYGYTQQEICNLGRSGIVDKNDPNLQVILDERARLGRSKGELTLIKKDGSKFPAEVSTSIFKDKNGNANTFMTIRDITTRKLAEEQINYQAYLLSQVNDAVFGLDTNFNITYWNKGAKQMYGYTDTEALGNNSVELLHPTYNPGEREKILEDLEQQGVSRTTIVTKHKNGTDIIVEQNSTRIMDDKGLTIGYVVVYRDITENKNAEYILKESENKFRTFFENIMDAVFLTIPDGTILAANPAAEKLFGYTEEEICKIGRNGLIDIADPNLSILIKERELKGRARNEITFIKKSGIKFPGEISTSIFVDGNGNKRTSMVIRDITKRRHIEKINKNLLDSEQLLTEELQTSNEELKQQGNELLRLNRNINDILESVQDNFYVINRNWDYVYINEKAASALGMEPEDFIGKNLWKMFPKYDGTNDGQKFRKSMEKREVSRFETYSKYTNVWYEVNVYPSTEGITILGTDITERKNIEAEKQKLLENEQQLTEELQTSNEELQCTTEELRTSNEELQIQQNTLIELNQTLHESQEKFFKAFHANPGAMTISDKDEFVDINESYAKLTGYSKNELIGHTSTELNIVSKEQRKKFLTELQEKGSIRGMEFDILTKTGEKRTVVSDAEAMILDGKIRTIAFNYDITDSKRNEKELKNTLKEYNRLNRTLIALRHSSYAMMHATNEKSYMEDICKIMVDDCGHSMVWIGFTEEEGKKVLPVAYSGFDKNYLRTLNITYNEEAQGQGPTGTAIRTGKPSICRNMQTDPKFKPWREEAMKRGYSSSIVLPITLEEQVIGALNIYSKETNPFSEEEIKLLQELADDISFGLTALRLRIANKIAEQALEESLLEVRRSNSELEQFAYITSHDLREPLRMITSFLQLLEKRYQDRLDDDANEFIGYAVGGAKRLDAMIQDILIYSKITNKERNFTHVNVNNVLEQTYLNLKAAIDENDAEITYKKLPSIFIDEQLMIQLFQNLISNSIKYRTEECPKIQISANKEGKHWLFCVKDNGIGISENHLDKIFTIFQRLHTHEEYEGTGIGLAIAQKIVHQHGGQIWAKSELEKGTTFYFTIPIKT
jgi:PAS domain S-box-containing protein